MDQPNPLSFLVGAAVILLWSYRDFHRPYARFDLATSVSKRRYLLSIVSYALISLFVYNIIALLYSISISYLFRSSDVGAKIIEQSANVPAARSMVSLLLFMLLSEIPGLRNIVASIRRTAQGLAQYPLALNQVVALLSSAKCNVSSDSRSKVIKELGRFGVVPDEIRSGTWLARAVIAATEVAHIRMRISEILNESNRFGLRRFFEKEGLDVLSRARPDA